jgi:predicted small metal-binding protein
MKEEMKNKIMQASCEDGFSVTSTNQNEVVKVMKEHIKNMHSMNVTDREVKEMICTC